MSQRSPSLLICSALAPLLFLACGGSQGSKTGATPLPSAPPITGEEAQSLTETFLNSEGNPSLISPFLNPASTVPIPLMPTVAAAPIPACAQVTVERPTPTSAKITLQLTDCPRGAASVSGRVVITANANPPAALVSFEPISALAGTRSWTLNGTKGFTRNAAASEISIQTNNFRVVFADSANPGSNRALTYSSTLTGSFATAGEYRVWGSFNLAVDGGATVSATIPTNQPLVYAAGCCHPLAGTIQFTKNGASTEATFLPACGSVRVTPAGGVPETRSLAACR